MTIKLAKGSRGCCPSRRHGGQADVSVYVTSGLVGTSLYLLNATISRRPDPGLLSGK
jgi:hypothetical protein